MEDLNLNLCTIGSHKFTDGGGTVLCTERSPRRPECREGKENGRRGEKYNKKVAGLGTTFAATTHAPTAGRDENGFVFFTYVIVFDVLDEIV